jgi:predicted nucleic acid-binding Zn ribbon protein
MSYRTYDYVCKNLECENLDKVDERMIEYEERDSAECENCGDTMKRLPAGIRTTHHSWSTWRI